SCHRLTNSLVSFFFFMTLPPPRSTLFPYTTLFRSNLSGESSNEIMEHIHKPQNALMHQKILKMLINGLTPILTEIIREGIEEGRSEEHTSELQSRENLVCRLLLEKKKKTTPVRNTR